MQSISLWAFCKRSSHNCTALESDAVQVALESVATQRPALLVICKQNSRSSPGGELKIQKR